ncbi:MAG TPA: MBL fold metallo-hydrolase [Solirubrobacteraceae bacterium]|jgi:glyoxylase-like metal-dependent hydrolase (beta-lactamase superfamily II)/rhodanese-related sulfurtransferase|nr:MBL fold metallo-hydrolase [Solirubrobacteraceae bacterium]
MIFRQIVHDDLGCASYFIGDEKAGVAAVVDPRFEIEEYLELARYLGVHIAHIFETHNHADHVSGHGRLAAATGAVIHIHRLVGPDFEHDPFDHGDEFELGSLRIKALHTPGHRPEHTCFLLADVRRGKEPWAVLTGDSLFVGDVARPDLAVERTQGARGIYRSLRDQLLSLPDYVEVWPGHLGGSMCGGPGMDLKVASTIGFERHHNEMLAIEDEQEFITASVSKLGAQPPNFKAIIALNHGPLLTDGVEPARLFPGQLEQRQREGALVVDVRTDAQFAEGHVPGSVSIPLHRGGFGTKLAWVAAGASQIVFVGRDDQDGRRAGSLAAAVGLADAVRRGGLLAGGWTSWNAEGHPLMALQRIRVDEIGPELDATPPAQVLDVREVAEFQTGYIPGSVNVPWHDIDQIPAGIDPSRRLLVICASGQRAGTAASLLQRLGASDVLHVAGGGVPKWGTLGGSLITEIEPQTPALA